MKTTLRDLSETYASAIADQTVLAGKPIVPEDICHAFCDGFKACEAKMLESAASDFSSFFDSITESEWADYYDTPDANEIVESVSKRAFTAGAMSQAKRVKELEDAIKEAMSEMGSSSLAYHILSDALIKQGGEK